jgi:hypothetical protein
MNRKLNSFGESERQKFGDYLLFQEYKHVPGEEYYKISKPILVIFLGSFIMDMAIGFNYVRWNNDNHSEFITNEYVTKYRIMKEVKKIEQYVEWNDSIDILGHWSYKPTWKEIIAAYRKQNTSEKISEEDVN